LTSAVFSFKESAGILFLSSGLTLSEEEGDVLEGLVSFESFVEVFSSGVLSLGFDEGTGGGEGTGFTAGLFGVRVGMSSPGAVGLPKTDCLAVSMDAKIVSTELEAYE
jgi:hypothetical protein